MWAICQCIIETQRRLHKAASVAANGLYAPRTASRSVAKSTPWRPFQHFQNAENSSRSAFAWRLSTNRLPAGAGRTGPPSRNCLRRLSSVGPDSRGSAPKGRFFSARQCRIARFAALSGITDGWRRVFRGAGSRASCGRRRYDLRKASDILSAIWNQPGQPGGWLAPAARTRCQESAILRVKQRSLVIGKSPFGGFQRSSPVVDNPRKPC